MADFESLYRCNRDFIFRFLWKLCKDQGLAEELTQEAFFKAYINFPSLRDESKAKIWLCRIAQNAFYAWARERKNFVVLDENITTSQDSEDAFLRKELNEQVQQAVADLESPYL